MLMYVMSWFEIDNFLIIRTPGQNEHCADGQVDLAAQRLEGLLSGGDAANRPGRLADRSVIFFLGNSLFLKTHFYSTVCMVAGGDALKTKVAQMMADKKK